MKKIILSFSFILLISTAAFAQDYRVVTIQILKAAKYPVEFADRSLAVYAIQYVTDESAAKYTFRNDTMQAREAALGIKQTMEEWEAFADYDVPVYDLYAFCHNNVCNDSIENISDFNLLVAVRNVSIIPFQRVEKRYDDDYGYYYNVGTYAPYTATFEVYDRDKKQFLYKETMSDTLVWDKNAMEFERTLKELPSTAVAAQLAAAEIGKLYAEQLVPHWVSVQRFFFVPSGRDLKKAADYAEDSQWGEAMKIWEQYAGSSNRKLAAQAAFNMALACEINGNYELSLEWLDYADKTYTIKEVDGYRAILQRRISESSILEKQLQDL